MHNKPETSVLARVDRASFRLKTIIAILRQFGHSHWDMTDDYLPDALGAFGEDLDEILSVLREAYDHVPEKNVPGSLEHLLDILQSRTRLTETNADLAAVLPSMRGKDPIEWLSEPTEDAKQVAPDSAREWAAKVLLMTVNGETLERESHLQALIDDARETLGIETEGRAAA
ncbi:MAG: hypothetical protein ACFB03_19505 [Paracoccaceae bacterium]|mgnify:CR=1 FL=1